MNKFEKIFSKYKKDNHIIYRIFGIKFAIKDLKYYEKETTGEIIIQDSYDLEPLKNAKKIILFLIPFNSRISGGIMSIFSLCETSRKLNSDSVCIISTLPGKYTYASNDNFLNNEKIYRFSQVVDNCKNLESIIIHIPELYVKHFYKGLKKSEKTFLKSIKDVQLNILNQNIELMPKLKTVKKLYNITNNITQTTAHNRYTTQEMCDKWQMPTHLFSVSTALRSKYKPYPFEEKEKIIVLSPDENVFKEAVVNKLKSEFPDFKFITVQNMTFSEYMDLIGRAYFTVTFGEGMDGYLLQPQYVSSIGFAVYNDEFFPSKSWKELLNVYNSSDDMLQNIADDMKRLLNDKSLYQDTVNTMMNEISKIYHTDKFENNLKRFYNKEYDFYPNKK